MQTSVDEILLSATILVNCSNEDAFSIFAYYIQERWPRVSAPTVVADLDGTLIVRDFDKLCASPFVDRIRSLGELMFVLTNQGGIAMRLANQRPEKKYPDWPRTEERILAGMRISGAKIAFVSLWHPLANIPCGELLVERVKEIGLPVPPPYGFVVGRPEGYICASWDPRWRKPSGFVLYLINQHFSPVIFVGDEESDKLSAQNAGVKYISVEEIATEGHVNCIAETCAPPDTRGE